ncbi:MAG: Lrp/AsnC family transcriptional regulator [Spirochaetia bacterium]|jgi:Lrp/AsnC family transcriptional regulator for asnA, asnC and gidA|nr:Lrp/AsnC family transcriptional regulator [Spirochaetia bacterium]
MTTKLDDTNKQIIRELIDGRKPFSAIAEHQGITENTVRSRVNKLIDEGILSITGLVDPEKFSGMQVVIMGVKLKTLDLEQKAIEFTQLRGVVSAAVVTGRYDLVCELVLNEDDGLSLLDFFKYELGKVSEVADVETFIVYQSHNLKVPYIL